MMPMRIKLLLGGLAAGLGLLFWKIKSGVPMAPASLAPPSAPPPTSAGQNGEQSVAGTLIASVLPKNGASTDDVATAVQGLTHDGLCGLAAQNAAAAVSFTGSPTIVQASWPVTVFPSKVPAMIACVSARMAPLSQSTQIGFSSPTFSVSPANA